MVPKCKVHAISSTCRFWLLPIQQSVKMSGISYKKPMNLFQAEYNTLPLSTDANPSPSFLHVHSFIWPIVFTLIAGFISLPQDPPQKPQDLDIEQLLAIIGKMSPWPHLCVKNSFLYHIVSNLTLPVNLM